MKIAYAGYDFLIDSLKALHEQHKIQKIFTIPSGDGYDLNEQVLLFAEEHHIPVVTEPIQREDMEVLLSQNCEVLLAAGYPYRIPVDTKLPAINIHPTLLPVGRGPWPMPADILKGTRRSGVTIHKIATDYDAGDILLQEAYELEERENLLTLSQKIQKTAKELLVNCFEDFEALYKNATPQCDSDAEYWPEPTDEDRTIHMDMPIEEVDRKLRAFAGYGCLLKTEKELFTIDMIRFRKVELSDMEQVNSIRERYHNTLSAYTFPCIYCWRNIQELTIYMESDWFIVKCDGNDFYYPCGNPTKSELFLRFMKMRREYFRLGYIPENVKELVEDDPDFMVTQDRDNYDYLVPMQQIAALEGKHFKTIRKEVHQFERSGVLEVEELNEDNVHEVERLAIEWSEYVTGVKDSADTIAEESAVKHFTELKMQGILAKKDGEYFGFVMGSRLDDQTIDAHFSKCIDKSPGADFFCKQKFCEYFADQYEYMNMEEDMGIEGIRTRKMLFRPTSLTPVFLASYGKQNGEKYGQW